MTKRRKPQFAICTSDAGYVDDLKPRTVYQVLPDEPAAKSNYIRVIDETGEDYLFPVSHFVFVDLPPDAAKSLTIKTT
jgi:hypothetical protein